MILVLGLAETGVAVARRLRAEGSDVVIVEDTPAATDRYRERVGDRRRVGCRAGRRARRRAGRGLAAAAELVVPSPLVRASHPAIVGARAAGVPVRSEIDIAAERAAMPIVAVTGTNGKTTVTSLCAAMLDASGVPTLAAGNIGRPLIDAITDDVAVVVAEVSSFQLAFAETFRPAVAVLLAITPDHLDWHGTSTTTRPPRRASPNTSAPTTCSCSTPTIAARRESRRYRAHGRSECHSIPTPKVAIGCLTTRSVFPDGTELAPLSTMKRALLARSHERAGSRRGRVRSRRDTGRCASTRSASYATMPHRVALVGEAIGVRWYDDSKATNPDATLRALASFDSVVLLAGGRNKGLDLSVLRTAAPRLRAVVAFGEAAPEIEAAFQGLAAPAVVRASSMHDAVAAAHRLAQAGDVVLLSPACASFDAYADYGAARRRRSRPK